MCYFLDEIFSYLQKWQLMHFYVQFAQYKNNITMCEFYLYCLGEIYLNLEKKLLITKGMKFSPVMWEIQPNQWTLGYIEGDGVNSKSGIVLSVFYAVFFSNFRLFTPNLVPPKIPDGERVDFDVSILIPLA